MERPFTASGDGSSPRAQRPAQRRRLQVPQPGLATAVGADAGAGSPADPHVQSPVGPTEVAAPAAAPGGAGGSTNAQHEAAAMASQRGEAQGRSEGGDRGEGELPPCECCLLCMHILHEPVTTPCSHTFCGRCFRRWADVSNRGRNGLRRATAAAAATPAGPALPPATPGGSGGERSTGQRLWPGAAAEPQSAAVTCPLCRSQVPVQLPTNIALAAEVQARHPAAYATRGSDIATEEAQLAAVRIISKKLYVGNLHSRIPDQGRRSDSHTRNVHNWTFFVRMDSEEEEGQFIERVVVHLHPTFNPPVVSLHQPPFSVRRVGWGIFVVRAEVHFRERWSHPPVWCRWLLDFDGGDMVEAELEFTRPQQRQTAEEAGGTAAPGGDRSSSAEPTGAAPAAAGGTAAAGRTAGSGPPPPGTPGAMPPRGSISAAGPLAAVAPGVAAGGGGGGGAGGNGTIATQSLWIAPTLRDMLEAAAAMPSEDEDFEIADSDDDDDVDGDGGERAGPFMWANGHSGSSADSSSRSSGDPYSDADEEGNDEATSDGF